MNNSDSFYVSQLRELHERFKEPFVRQLNEVKIDELKSLLNSLFERKVLFEIIIIKEISQTHLRILLYNNNCMIKIPLTASKQLDNILRILRWFYSCSSK